MTKIEKRYISQDEIKRYCLNIVSMMFRDDFKPDIIVGITRGGLWPAMMLSHYLDIKMYTLDVRLRDGDTKENATFLKTQIVKNKLIRHTFIVFSLFFTSFSSSLRGLGCSESHSELYNVMK